MVSHLNPSPPITHLIVPEDFDEKVNKIQGTENYRSERGQLVVAKYINTERGDLLVFSKFLYTNPRYDDLCRMHFYVHELVHACNKIRFPSLNTQSISKYQYLFNLYLFFDEYDANRKAYGLVGKLFPDTSPMYRWLYRVELKSFIKSLLDNSLYFDKIRSEIIKFKTHGEINYFCDRIKPYFDEVTKSVVYVYSCVDHWDKLQRLQPLLLQSKFINDNTMNLIGFFRSKFDENNPNLSDGELIFSNYMENFGVRFEDAEEGLCCHVLNI